MYGGTGRMSWAEQKNSSYDKNTFGVTACSYLAVAMTGKLRSRYVATTMKTTTPGLPTQRFLTIASALILSVLSISMLRLILFAVLGLASILVSHFRFASAVSRFSWTLSTNRVVVMKTVYST